MISRLFIITLSLLFVSICLPKFAQAQNSFQNRYTMMTGPINPDSLVAKNRVLREKLVFHKKRINGDDVELVKLVDKPTRIIVFLGTWCPDSQRNVPPFMNLIEAAANNNIEVEYIGVNLRKVDPDGLVNTYGVRRVPTFIVMRDGQEVGRLVERPSNTVEKDIIQILEKK